MIISSPDFIMRTRQICLGLTGLICLAYAVGAVLGGTPQPFSPWLPGLMGLLAAAAITLSAFVAGQHNARRAMDEFYRSVDHRAQRYAYWFALALYPAFGLLLGFDMLDYPVAFAAMGTLTGAAYLLLVTLFDLRTS